MLSDARIREIQRYHRSMTMVMADWEFRAGLQIAAESAESAREQCADFIDPLQVCTDGDAEMRQLADAMRKLPLKEK